MVEFISTSGAPRPFSAAVRAGGFLYVSGQVGIDRKTGIYPDTIGGQTVQAIANLREILQGQGCQLSDVIKMTVLLTDSAFIAEFNAAYQEAFPTAPPARTLAVVKALAGPAQVELDAIAFKEPAQGGSQDGF